MHPFALPYVSKSHHCRFCSFRSGFPLTHHCQSMKLVKVAGFLGLLFCLFEIQNHQYCVGMVYRKCTENLCKPSLTVSTPTQSSPSSCSKPWPHQNPHGSEVNKLLGQEPQHHLPHAQ